MYVCGEDVKTGVVVLFHGSRAEGAGEAVQRIIAEVRRRGGYEIVEEAFLQHAAPALHEAIEKCVRQQQVGHVVIVPFFLQMGMHVTAEIPSLIEEAEKRYPHLKISVADAVGAHPLMVEVVLDLVGKAK